GTAFLVTLFSARLLPEPIPRPAAGAEPKVPPLVLPLRFKSVQQSQTLDQSQRDDGQQARIGYERDHPAQAKSRAFRQREALRILDELLCDEVQTLDRHQVHAAEIGNMQAGFARKVGAQILGIDFNRAQPLKKTKAKQPPDRRTGGGVV